MIVDIHCHVFPERIAAEAFRRMSGAAGGIPVYTAGTAEALAASSARAGVGLSVVQPVATNPLKVDHLNAFAAEINRRTAETGVMSFAALHPLMPGLKEAVRAIRREGFAGVKLHPVYQDTPVDEPAFLRALSCCYEEGLTVLIHAGPDIGKPGDQASVARLRRMLKALPPRGLILAHMGGWGEWDQVDFAPQPGLYLDTAFCLETHSPVFLPPEACRDMIRRFGADRVLFGTDSPWNDQAEDVKRLSRLGLTDQELWQVLGGNARALLSR